jgi:hypothetical protein
MKPTSVKDAIASDLTATKIVESLISVHNRRLAGGGFNLNEAETPLAQAEDVAAAKLTDDIAKELSSQMAQLTTAIKTETEKANKQQPQQEAVGIMVAGIALAMPAILKVIKTVGDFLSKKVKEKLGVPPTEKNALDKWLENVGELSEKIHHLYIGSIEKVVSLFVKDQAKSKQVSSFIFHCVVATFMILSGLGAVKAFTSTAIIPAILETAMTAIKSGEVGKYIGGILGATAEA